MGRQGDKNRKKALSEVDGKHVEVKTKPIEENGKPAAYENKHEKQGSVLSCANLLMMLFTIVVAILVTSLIVKAAELQQLNTEQDLNMRRMKAEAKDLKQKLEKSLSESFEKVKSDELLIQSLKSENEDLEAKIKENDLQLENKDKVLNEFQESELNLQEENKKKQDTILSLTKELNAQIDSLETEKKTILEKLEESKQEKSSIEQNCDNDLSNLRSEKEAQAKELEIVISKKEDDMLMKSKTIESLEEMGRTLSDGKIQLSEKIDSLKVTNEQISEELVSKSETIESLHEQNVKLSKDMVIFRDETSKAIDILEQEKNNCIAESESSTKSLREEIQIKVENIKQLQVENQNLESTSQERIATLEREYKHKLDILEDSKGTLMELLKSEKQEKNNILDAKTSSAIALEDLQLEMDKVAHNLKMSQTDLEKCNNEILVEMDRKEELSSKITVLSQEKLKMESECKTTSEQLATVESECRKSAEKLAKFESEKEEMKKKSKNQN